MNPLVREFSDLKLALQELESAVQQPRDEANSVERILYYFPAVITRLAQVLSEALLHADCEPVDLQDIFTQHHKRAWLTGEIGLWLHLVSEYEHMGEIEPNTPRGISLAQHIRACSSMLWQTYDLLTQRFRWQTQSMAIPARLAAPQLRSYPARAV
jgi:hypothetical protein